MGFLGRFSQATARASRRRWPPGRSRPSRSTLPILAILYRRDGRIRPLSAGGRVRVGALPAGPRVLHALPAARGRFGPRHHLRPRPHLEPAALRGRHRGRRAARRGAAGRQRRAVRPVRLHRGPRHAARRARVGRPGLPGVARHRARPAHRPVRRLPVRVPHLRDDRPGDEHAGRPVRLAAGEGVAARPARPRQARAGRRHGEPRHREAGGGLLHRHGARSRRRPPSPDPGCCLRSTPWAGLPPPPPRCPPWRC